MALYHTAHLTARTDAIKLFRERLLLHARTSLAKEPGCLLFDIHQSAKDPELFLLIEVYSDEAAFDAHRTSPHYLEFRKDVEDWVVERTWWYWKKLSTQSLCLFL